MSIMVWFIQFKCFIIFHDASEPMRNYSHNKNAANCVILNVIKHAHTGTLVTYTFDRVQLHEQLIYLVDALIPVSQTAVYIVYDQHAVTGLPSTHTHTHVQTKSI